MKKILSTFLCIFFICPCAFGFWFKKKNLTFLDKKEKLSFVNMQWWERFNDNYLTCYIATAVINNHDARKASFKVKEYQEFVKYQFGQELPSIESGANYYGIHLPKTEAEILYRENVFTIPFTAKYQADIFLKNRNKTKSREKEVEMSKFQEKSVYISLATSVATDYLNILKYDKKISIQQRVIKIKQESLIREKNKFSRGVSTQLKVNELKKATENSKNSLENLISSRTKALTELSTLIGDSPENISNLKRGTFDKFDFHGKIPNCIKSEVIFTRPDILEKEAGLEKAQIDIKIARKELLPSINISASYIFTNLANQNFFNWNSAIASVVAGLSQELFKGGMRLANLRIYKIKYEELFETYRQTDLNALKEVKDALSFIAQDEKIDKNTINNFHTQKNNYKRVSNKYLYGVTNYQNLLSEREKMLDCETQKADTKSIRIADYITLYNSVGGNL